MKKLFLFFLLMGCQVDIDCLDGCQKPTDKRKDDTELVNGPQGPVGPQGPSGQSCTVSDDGMIACGKTFYQLPLPKGGVDGKSCTAVNKPDSVILACEDGTAAVIYKPKDGLKGDKGDDGQSCSVNNSGMITCGATHYQIPLPKDGAQGATGKDGGSCSVVEGTDSIIFACENGTTATIAKPKDGKDGVNGTNGTNGSSCSVTENTQTITVSCTDGTLATWNKPKDGAKGDKGDTGAQGPAGSGTILETINPCGTNKKDVDEILIRLSDNKIVAWYKNVGLVILGPGAYETTDHDKCKFTVNEDLSIEDEDGQVWLPK